MHSQSFQIDLAWSTFLVILRRRWPWMRFSFRAIAVMMMLKEPTIIELEMDELEDILRRVETKQLEDGDSETIKAVFRAYVHLTETLKDKNVSMNRLRKMLFGATTEKTSAILGKDADSSTSPSPADENSSSESDEHTAETPERQEKKPAKGHGRNGADAYTGADKIEVRHESLQPGDACPKCEKGTVYETNRPGVVVRLTGQPPVGALVYYLQKLRCNLCGTLFTADPPEGVGTEKYDATVGSMIALLKYGTGVPFNREEQLQKNLGIPLPASTQWEIVEAQAERAEPVFGELIRQAADGEVVHNDDTTVKILELMEERAQQAALAEEACEESSADSTQDPDAQRKGMFTTGIVSTQDGHKIALFLSGHQHAGENLKDVLQRRAANLPPPIQMCDALSRNLPGDLQTIVANCLAHGRRQFVDVAELFPEECRHVLESLAVVYRNDAIARERKLSPQQRLIFHQTESGPTMDELRAWLTRQFDERLVEPNSALGKAVAYLLRHWEKLTLFLRVPGAPLDNNVCERALKKAIRHRRNSLFYKTRHGAHVGDVFMSLIHTCELCKTNPFDYLTELERHAKEAAGNPQSWMPWNYRQTLDQITPQ